ncbi:MAG: Tim44 domain-containing protein [Candidatus Rokubacteria bacterium]|nr:Tim44 domain-containing protein [Candidatus Rokubacteria bacterium]MBI3826123.1 Tim44 domain-containing protein [Candidatus Rokubacteria bacterium]
MKPSRLVLAAGVLALTWLVSDAADVWARAGGGSGGGSRGSRSYSAPARPSSPAAPAVPQSPSPVAPAKRPGFFGGGFMGGLAGFALGGLLGSMLFGGLGHGGFGIGLFDIVLIGAGILLLMVFLRRRQAQPAYAGAVSAYGSTPAWGSSPAVAEAPAPQPGNADLAAGVAHIRQMDPSFNTAYVADVARGMFLEVQAAVARRDLTAVRERLTAEMFGVLQPQVDKLRDMHLTNIIDGIEIRRADVSEAWQESGQDYITVCFEVGLMDYTIDDATGGLVDGSRTVPQQVNEFWTFVRPVGPNRWQLSAIQTG